MSNLQDIASVIRDKNDMSSIDAKKFLKDFFTLISDGLNTDKIVKIKGLGTFKIVDVQDRESVNVNTGERVVIEGHGKITFVPDTVMKEFVNRPFAQFETVVINDGVDFSEIDKKENEEEKIVEPAKTETPVKVTEIPTKVSEKSAMVAEPVIAKKSEQKKGTKTANESAKAESTTITEKPAKVFKSATVNVTTEPIDNISDDKRFEKEPATISAENQSVDDSAVNQSVDDSDENPHKNHVFVKILILLLVAALFFIVGLFIGKTSYNSSIINKSAIKVNRTIQTNKANKAIKTNRTIQANKAIKANKTIQTDKTKKIQVKQNEKESNTFDSEKYDLNNREVRTGAYRIIGIENEITIKSEESLKKISHRTLGPGMECYISAFNECDENTVFKKGQTVKIPKLQLRRLHKQR